MDSASGNHPNFEEDFAIIQSGEFLTLRRYDSEGKYYRGKFIRNRMYTEHQIQCSFQPITGREILQLPEGDRLKDHAKVYSEFAMKDGDVIVRDGKTYEVQAAYLWGTYSKAIVVQEDVDVERD